MRILKDISKKGAFFEDVPRGTFFTFKKKAYEKLAVDIDIDGKKYNAVLLGEGHLAWFEKKQQVKPSTDVELVLR